MRKIVLIILFINISLGGVSAFGQKQTEKNNSKNRVLSLLDETQKKYSSVLNYDLYVDYSLYINYTSSQINTQYQALYARRGDKYYSKVENVESYMKSGESIKIYHQQKLIEYNKSKSITLTDAYFSFAQYLDHFVDFELTENSSSYICILKGGPISAVPYSKIIIEIDRSSGLVVRQTYYFLIRNSYLDSKEVEKSDFPRLEITFKNLIIESQLPSSLFELGNYITKNKNSITPSLKYKDYRFEDLSKK